MIKSLKTTLMFGATALSMCALSACDDKAVSEKTDTKAAFASTYTPRASESLYITNAHILDGIGGEFETGSLLIENGKITQVGDFTAELAEGIKTIDAGGAWITPGVIDIHSHLGVYATPGVRAHSDGNDATSPITAEVYAEHGVCPKTPGLPRL